jgi:hypothetical protein
VRLQHRLFSLKQEALGRRDAFRALKKQYCALLSELKESPSPLIEPFLRKKNVSRMVMETLKKAIEELENLRIERLREIQTMRSELAERYKLLMIPEHERHEFPDVPTAANIRALEHELNKRSAENPTRAGAALAIYQRQIDKLCAELHVADAMRPTYTGGDPAAALEFYRSAVEDLKGLASERLRLIQMAETLDRSGEEFEIALERYASRSGESPPLKGWRGVTKTELSMSGRSHHEPRVNLSAELQELFVERIGPARAFLSAPATVRKTSLRKS